MEQIYTPETLLLFICNETSALQTAQIEKALAADANLNQQYLEMKNDLQLLENFTPSPSPKSIQAILNHSYSQEKLVGGLQELSH